MSGQSPTRRTVLTWAAGAACCLAGARPTLGAVPAVPSRIATLDYGLAETLLVLGRTPIAIASAADWTTWVVEPPLPATVADLGAGQDPNLERLAALRPDLILSTDFVAMVEPALHRIAPVERLTIYQAGSEPLSRAIEIMQILGQTLDLKEAAAAVLAAFDAELDALKAKLDARKDQPPVLLVSFLDARHVRVYGQASLYGNVLPRLGLRNAWTSPVNYWGFATVGIEDLAAAGECRLVTFEPVPADVWPTLATSPLWTALPFVRADRTSVLPPVLMFGAVPSAGRFARIITAHLTDLAA